MGECAGEDAVEEAVSQNGLVPQADPDEGEHGGVDEREQQHKRRLPPMLWGTPRRRRIVEPGGGGGRHVRGRRRRRGDGFAGVPRCVLLPGLVLVRWALLVLEFVGTVVSPEIRL